MGVGKPDDIVGAVAARGRHVRLRAADPLRANRAGADPARFGQPSERAPRRGSAAPRPGLRLPDLPWISPGLSAPRGPVGRDHRCDAADLAQPSLLPGADVGAARAPSPSAGWLSSSGNSRRNAPQGIWSRSERDGAARARHPSDPQRSTRGPARSDIDGQVGRAATSRRAPRRLVSQSVTIGLTPGQLLLQIRYLILCPRADSASGAGQKNACSPVWARPRISAWTSWVPS